MERELALSELDFFLGLPDLMPVYLSLRARMVSLAPACEIRVHKTMISFRAPRPFAYVGVLPQSRSGGFSRLILSFASEIPLSHPLVIDSVLIRKGLYTVHAHVPPSGLIEDELIGFVRSSLTLRNRSGKK